MREDLDDDRPTVVHLSGAANLVYERATELAEEGREDAAAVAELVTLASGESVVLRRAALAARLDGEHHDHADSNRAHRLLQAAVRGGDIPRPSPEELQRFEILDPFVGLPPSGQWTQLVQSEPRLLEIEREVVSGAYVNRARLAGLKSIGRSARPRETLAYVSGHQQLEERLSALVGPDSGHDDILLSSRAAYEATYTHLFNFAGTAGDA